MREPDDSERRHLGNVKAKASQHSGRFNNDGGQRFPDCQSMSVGQRERAQCIKGWRKGGDHGPAPPAEREHAPARRSPN